MTVDAAPIALTVLSPSGRRDVVVRRDARVGQLAEALSLPLGLATLDGTELRREARLDEVLHSGDAVVAADRATSRRVVGPVGTARADGVPLLHQGTRALPTPAIAWTGVALLLLALVPRLIDLASGAPAVPRAAAAAAVGALLLALLPPLDRAAADAVTTAAWLAGALVGLFAASSHPAAGMAFPLTLALCAATVAAAVRTSRTTGRPGPAVLPRTLLLVGGVAAGAGVAGIALGVPYPVPVLLGLVPVALRATPAASLAIPEAVLLDPAPSQRTATKVREPRVPAPASVRWETIAAAVALGRRRRRATAIVLGCATAVLALVLAARLPAGGLELIATAVLGLVVALACLLLARRDREPVAAWVTRGSGAVALVPGLAALLAAGIPALVPFIVLALAAGIAIAVAPAAARGWRSLRLSRGGDVLESLAVALAPALGLVAAGAVAGMMLEAAG